MISPDDALNGTITTSFLNREPQIFLQDDINMKEITDSLLPVPSRPVSLLPDTVELVRQSDDSLLRPDEVADMRSRATRRDTDVDDDYIEIAGHEPGSRTPPEYYLSQKEEEEEARTKEDPRFATFVVQKSLPILPQVKPNLVQRAASEQLFEPDDPGPVANLTVHDLEAIIGRSTPDRVCVTTVVCSFISQGNVIVSSHPLSFKRSTPRSSRSSRLSVFHRESSDL